MRRLLISVLMASILLGSCEPPPPDPGTPVTVDGTKVATATVKAVLTKYTEVSVGDKLTISGAVEVPFSAVEAGLMAGGVWDTMVGPLQMKVSAIVMLAENGIRTGLVLGGVWDYVLFDPGTPHAELGNGLAKIVAMDVVDVLSDGKCTVGDLYSLPTKATEFVLKETGKWDVPFSAAPGAPPTTVGAVYSSAVEKGKGLLGDLNLWEYVVFTVQNPPTEDVLIPMVP
jgi:hypothetical protein